MIHVGTDLPELQLVGPVINSEVHLPLAGALFELLDLLLEHLHLVVELFDHLEQQYSAGTRSLEVLPDAQVGHARDVFFAGVI